MLAGVDLSGLDFRDAILEKVNLAKANLSQTNLTGAVLAGANLREATCVGAIFAGADLTEAWMTHADCSGADFEGRGSHQGAAASGQNGRRQRGRIRSSSKQTCPMPTCRRPISPRQIFVTRCVHRTDFSRANLTDAAFENAWGRHVKAVGATLVKVRGAEALLPEADFRDCMADESVWESAALFGANFSGSSLNGAEFSDAYLADALFAAAELKGARLNEATLRGAHMRRCNLLNASLDQADLTDATLSESNLFGATLMDAVQRRNDLHWREPAPGEEQAGGHMIVETVAYMGPGRVLAGPDKPGYVHVALADNRAVWARMAMAVPYSPEPGDEVLVVCNEPPDAYVIGVLHGHGTTTLRVQADLRLEAPRGDVHILAGKSIHLRSEESLELNAPRATFRFARLNVLVTTLVQRLTNAFTWATGLVQSKGRRLRWIADEGWLVRAGRAHVRTTENIHINGKTVHLG